jgi:hypothetical protein
MVEGEAAGSKLKGGEKERTRIKGNLYRQFIEKVALFHFVLKVK